MNAAALYFSRSAEFPESQTVPTISNQDQNSWNFKALR
jgi:hypothetical protein